MHCTVGVDIAKYCMELSDMNTRHRSMEQRYFVRRYKFDARQHTQEDLCILEHTNRICVLTLADSHPVVSQCKKISKIDFLIDVKSTVNESTELCHIACHDGSVYTVHASVRGKLVELNERLTSNTQLAVDQPNTEGFLAMLLPRKPEHNSEMQKLSTADEYKHLLMRREEPVS